MNTQLRYYTSKQINPVEISLGGKKWSNHFEQRLNLLERHLKLPASWFQGRRVLEFGPNKGENSLIFAKLGADVTLVEPNHLMHQGIKDTFQKHNQSHRLKKIHPSILENFVSQEKFDIVWAEGFLHALESRGKLIQKLCSFSSDKVVFTYSDINGYFFESFKRFLFKSILEVEKIKEHEWEEIYKVAKLLFLKSFLKLNSSRSFESWVRDVIINPCQVSSSLDKFSNLINYSEEIGYDYYSGSPSWDMRNNLTWYKKINNNSIIAEYNKNISFFIMGNNECNFDVSDIDKINKLTQHFIDYSSNIPLRDRLESIKFPTKFPFNDIQNILNKVKNFDDLIISYVGSRISDFWGMPNHHVCLSKTQSL